MCFSDWLLVLTLEHRLTPVVFFFATFESVIRCGRNADIDTRYLWYPACLADRSFVRLRHLDVGVTPTG
jgi:hypothetical protein